MMNCLPRTPSKSAAAFVPILVGGDEATITFALRRRRVKFFVVGALVTQ